MSVIGEAGHYGSVAITLHWLTVAIILVTIPIGIATALIEFASQKSSHVAHFITVHAHLLLTMHASLGLLILLLTLTRLSWRIFDRRPGKPLGQPHWQALIARATHWLLYGFLVVLPASGISLIILSGAIPVLLGTVPGSLPHFSKFLLSLVHSLAAFTLIGLIAIHFGAVLYHQFYKRDRLLARMGVKIT
jgi:cytochrome b561